MVSASPGPLGGMRSQIVLKMLLDKLGLMIIPQSFALGMAHQAFDADGAMPAAPMMHSTSMLVDCALRVAGNVEGPS